MIPLEFWNSISTAITALTIATVFYIMSRMMKNVSDAFRKKSYIIHNHHYKLNNCTLIDPEELNK